MKALIIVSKFPPEYSGPGVRLPKLYDFLKQRFTIEKMEVLCNGIEQTKNSNYKFGDFEVHRRISFFRKGFPARLLPRKFYNVLAHWDEIRISLKFLKTLDKPDYIHILGTSGATAAGLFWANKHNIPVLMELVTAKAEPRQRFYGTAHVAPPLNATIIALTSAAVERCRKAGFKDGSIWLRPNPIHEDIFRPETQRKQGLRQTLMPFDHDDIVISSVAKIMPQKNQIFLLDVLRLLPQQYKLAIAGPLVKSGPLVARDHSYVEAIKSKIKEYNLEKRVHFVMDYVDSASYMKASDLYALPAYDEGFGTPMLEAIACGVPVIANKEEASFREWIIDDVNGYTCSMEPELWAHAIEKAASFPPDQVLKASEDVHKQAGKKNIYREYADRIERLTAS